MTSPDVAVIGGGFAGLSAAAALAEAGARVLVVDARPQLGGRATAFTDRKTGELVDNGQHVLFGCYSETLRFLSRVGAKGNVVVQPALSIPFVGRSAVRLCRRRCTCLRRFWTGTRLAGGTALPRCGWPHRCGGHGS
jgi:phytoene dehydrogenase-like protein